MATAMEFALDADDPNRQPPPGAPDASTEQEEPGEQLAITLPDDAKRLVVQYIAHARIHPDPRNPRSEADDELRASIAANGILQPITVRAIPPGMDGCCEDCGQAWSVLVNEHMIVFGERRWRGALGIMAFVPAIARSGTYASAGRRTLAQLVENFQRKDLSPLEEAYGYRDAMRDDPSLTQAELSRATGKSRSSITDRLALLRNSAWVPLLASGEITVSQMVEVSRYADRSAHEHATAIRAARNVAGDRRIADIEIAPFRTLVETVLYFDPNAPVKEPEPALALDQAPAVQAAPIETRHDEPANPAPVEASPATAEVQHDEVEPQSERPPERETSPDAATLTTKEGLSASPVEVLDAPASPAPSPKAASPVAREKADVAESHSDTAHHDAGGYGVFQQLAPLLGERPAMITIGPAKTAGSYRVNIIPTQVKKGEAATLTAPLSVDGTPEELDAELPAAIAEYLARRGSISRGVAKAAAQMAEAKKAAAPKATKTAAKNAAPKPAAKKTATKPVAKKAAVKKVAPPKPKPRGPAPLYPDAALAVLLGRPDATTLAAAVKAVQQYAKSHALVGTGGMRGLVSCDDALRAVFGAPIVKLNQMPKLLKSHLTTESSAPQLDPAQLDIVEALEVEVRAGDADSTPDSDTDQED